MAGEVAGQVALRVCIVRRMRGLRQAHAITLVALWLELQPHSTKLSLYSLSCWFFCLVSQAADVLAHSVMAGSSSGSALAVAEHSPVLHTCT